MLPLCVKNMTQNSRAINCAQSLLNPCLLRVSSSSKPEWRFRSRLEDHEDFILVWSPKKVFMCFSTKVGHHFFLNQTTLGVIFSRIVGDFAYTCRDFDHIFKDFARIFRNFARIFDKSKLLGCACTPESLPPIHHCFKTCSFTIFWMDKTGFPHNFQNQIPWHSMTFHDFFHDICYTFSMRV